MPVRARNTTPAIKDQVARISYLAATVPTGVGASLFMNPWYDFEIKSITALVRVATTAGAIPFTLGYGAYTNNRGVIVPENLTFFLKATDCIQANGSPLGTTALPAGTLAVMPIPADNGLGATILPAGAPLVIGGANVAGNAGGLLVTVILRPKDWDRSDSSKRPWGASDDAFANYYK